MTDRPIIFSAPMIRALLDGRKSQTRRVLKVQPRFDAQGCSNADVGGPWWDFWSSDRHETHRFKLPYAPGDRLWVREAFSYDRLDVERDGILPPWHWADGNPESGDWSRPKPSIHMPRWASRLTLIVTDVRVQRVQDISEADAQAEGLVAAYEGWATDREGRHWGPDARASYRVLWNDLHGEDAWERNDWVAALTFTVHRQNIDQMEPTND